MLGRYVVRNLQKLGYDIVQPSRSEMNLADEEGVYNYVLSSKPDAVLHLAAATDVDLCERDPAMAGMLNHIATGAVARAAKETGAWLLCLSTSNVFGLSGGTIYNELDIPSPINYYGRSKLFAEKEVEKALPNNSLIIRASWMIGGGREYDHKFIGKIIKQIESGAPSIQAVNDRYGTITSAADLSEFICFCLQKRSKGLVHFASAGVASRFDVANEIASILNYNGPIKPVLSNMFPLSAPRSVFEGIYSIYLDERMGFKVDDWRSVVRKYVTNEFYVSK